MGDIKRAVAALAGGERVVNPPLAAPPPKSAIAEGRGTSKSGTGGAGDGAGPTGIASPLTEVENAGVPDRTYYSERTIQSVDGLFVLRVKPIKTLRFTDAAARAIQIHFADSTQEP